MQKMALCAEMGKYGVRRVFSFVFFAECVCDRIDEGRAAT